MDEIKSNIDSFDLVSYEELIEMEQERQNKNVELIASENFPSERVLKAAGSILS